MISPIPKIAPPNRDAYGTDYMLYMKHYQAFRGYVISLRKPREPPKAPQQKPQAVPIQPVNVSTGPSKAKAVKPKKVTETVSLQKQLNKLKVLEEKAKTISNIVALNKQITGADGWATVLPKRKQQKAPVGSDRAGKVPVIAAVAKQDKIKVMANPALTTWSVAYTLVARRPGQTWSYSDAEREREFLRDNPKPSPYIRVNLVTLEEQPCKVPP